MLNAQILDVESLCLSFPEVPERLISHEHVLQAMDSRLLATPCIVLEGDEGIGKTTLLVQFARRHAQQTFALFIQPANRMAYDVASLKFDLCQQLSTFILHRDMDESDFRDESLLGLLLIRLQQRAQRQKLTYFFILDGYDGIPEKDALYREQIFDLLPLGCPQFRFLFASGSESLPEPIRRHLHPQSFPVYPFSEADSEEYFSQIVPQNTDVKYIHEFCHGLPGRLAIVYRLLENGNTSLSSLMNDMPKELEDLFRYEWAPTARILDEPLRMLLAVLAHDQEKHRISDLARLLHQTEETVQNLLRPLTFVSIKNGPGEVTFFSEAHRRYMVRELSSLKKAVDDLIIADLMKRPTEEPTLVRLPGLLVEGNRTNDLIHYLETPVFISMIDKQQSLTLAIRQAGLGTKTALELSRGTDAFRFSLVQSALLELRGTDVGQSEIEAYLAVGEYDTATVLAQQTMLKEDRLLLLAVIAKSYQQHAETPPPALLEQIRQVYDEVDREHLGEAAVEIAAILLYTLPELAIALVEESVHASGSDDSVDLMLMGLSLAAIEKREVATERFAVEELGSHIKDPEMRQLNDAIALLLHGDSGSDVIARAKPLNPVNRRVFFLGAWVEANARHPDALIVIDYALKVMQESNEYPHMARDYRKLAEALPYSRDSIKIQSSIQTMDMQKSYVEHHGPTQEYVQLQLLLARAEAPYDLNSALDRVITIWDYASNRQDLGEKTECFAWLVASIRYMQRDILDETVFGQLEQAYTAISPELEGFIQTLLATSADHYHALSNTLRTLAVTDRETALRVAQQLNTSMRRDQAIGLVTLLVAKRANNLTDSLFLQNAIKQICDPDRKAGVILAVLRRVAFLAKGKKATRDFFPFLDMGEQLQHAAHRCQAICLSHQILSRMASDRTLPDQLELAHRLENCLVHLHDTWSSIDVGWLKIKVGYFIVNNLAAVNPVRAKEYLELTEKVQSETTLPTIQGGGSYTLLVQLSVRAFSGLLASRINTDIDFKRLQRVIELLPSQGEQAIMWSRLAMRYFIADHADDAKGVVRTFVLPLLNSISQHDIGYRYHVINEVSPAIYCTHPATAESYLTPLPRLQQDRIRLTIARFILRKAPPEDPYVGTTRQVPDDEIDQICEIAEHMHEDALLYQLVKEVADYIEMGRPPRGKYRKEFQHTIYQRLRNVIESRLPQLENIRHKGYRIIALAQAVRIQPEKDLRDRIWSTCIEEARSIPNGTDRAYVLAILASLHPADKPIRRHLLEEAGEIARSFPATLDRIETLATLAEIILDMENHKNLVSLVREFVENAMNGTRGKEEDSVYSLQRHIIDLAYQCDALLAASLAALFDDDPARLQQQIELNQLKSQARTNGLPLLPGKTIEPESDRLYSKIAFAQIGRLHATGHTLHMPDLYDCFRVASHYSLSGVYDVYVWLVENANKRFAQDVKRGRDSLKPVYDTVIDVAEMTGNIVGLRSSRSQRMRQRFVSNNNVPQNAPGLIPAGKPEAAVMFLRTWFEKEVQEYVKICDPYFGLEELEWIHLLLGIHPECQVTIMTTSEKLPQKKVPAIQQFQEYWEEHYEMLAPNVEIAIIETASSPVRSPIHDRWITTKNAGLDMGTSFNGLGKTRVSLIKPLSGEEMASWEAIMTDYLTRKIARFEGEKLICNIFPLKL